MSIDWTDIKGIARQGKRKSVKEKGPSLTYKDNFFEELCIDFLKDATKNDNWKRTVDSAPGHDGVLCLYYDNSARPSWMEAKYKSSQKVLYRKPLDSTIIEILLRAKINTLYICTNCEIGAKAKSDIRELIVIQQKRCRNVKFVTGSVLELWLSADKRRVEKYFKSLKEIYHETNFSVAQELEIYDCSDLFRFIQQPLEVLRKGKYYYAMTQIFAFKKEKLSVTSEVFNVIDKEIKLTEGLNEVIIKIRVNPNVKFYGYGVLKFTSAKTEKTCKTRFKISITDKEDEIRLTDSQTECFNAIKSYLSEKDKPKIVILGGKKGVGKSFLIEYIKENIDLDSLFAFYSFKSDGMLNLKNLVGAIMFLLFPYGYDGENLNYKAFKNFVKTDLHSGEFLYRLSRFNINRGLELSEFLDKTSGESDTFLFKPIQSGKKFIFFDDVDKLAESHKSFVEKICFNLIENSDDVVLFLVCDDEKAWNVPKSLKLNLDIRRQDVKAVLGLDLPQILVSEYFPDYVLLFLFKQFLTDNDLEVGCVSDFKVNYSKFLKRGGISLLLAPLTSNLSKDQRLLLNRIYYSVNGISLNGLPPKLRKDADALLKKGLIKYTMERKATAFHELYSSVYINENLFDPEGFLLIPPENETERLKATLMSIDVTNAKSFIAEIQNLKELYRFDIIFYVLKDVIVYKDRLLSQLGAYYYYLLEYLLIYADANVRATTAISCGERFTRLYLDIKDLPLDSDMLLLCCETCYESSNSAYDNMRYTECLSFREEFRLIISEARKLGLDVDTENIKSQESQMKYLCALCDAEQGLERENVPCESEGLYRYLRAKSISKSGANEFISYAETTLTEQCRESNPKHYYKADFDAAYIKTALNILRENWYTVILEKREAVKWHGSGYLNATQSLISLLLVKDSITQAEILYAKNRPEIKNARRQGYEKELEAAFAFYRGDIEKATECLMQQGELFKNCPSYLEIVELNLRNVLRPDVKKSFKFYFKDEPSDENCFYLDPRCFY